MRRHQAFALPPVSERRFRVYEEAPVFRHAPRKVEQRRRLVYLITVNGRAMRPCRVAGLVDADVHGDERRGGEHGRQALAHLLG